MATVTLEAIEALPVKIDYVGETTRDNWQCDQWRVTLSNNSDSHSFDYFTGLGLREPATENDKRRAARDFHGLTENDKKGSTSYGRRYLAAVEKQRKPRKPKVAGVLHSLILDASACEESFVDWCANFGYDEDSRKALVTYLECQQNGARTRAIFGNTLFAQLAEILQDY